MLLYTDGACINNGQPSPRAGWAFVYGLDKATCDGRLENKGPFGGPVQPQASNRAELRAVIAALRFRHWVGEGFTSMVIATDSEYIVIGATTWAKEWMRNGWRTSAGAVVKNRDLWEALLGEVERWDGEGLEVVFWRTGRELNSVADAAAKKVAKEGADADEFFTTHGIACRESSRRTASLYGCYHAELVKHLSLCAKHVITRPIVVGCSAPAFVCFRSYQDPSLLDQN